MAWRPDEKKAHVDLWMKKIAPSIDLRKWFGHDPERWREFGTRYRRELIEKCDDRKSLRGLEKMHGTITLLYGVKDEKRNNAVVLGKAMTRARRKPAGKG